MKKVLFSVLTIFILFLLQTSVFHYFSINGIVPNFILIAICFYGYMRGENSGIIAGFFCGILLDVFYANNLGFHSIIFMYIGYFNGMLNHFVIEDDHKMPIFCVAVSDIVYSFITYCLQFLLVGKFDLGFYFLNVILPEFVYTIILALALYPCFMFIENTVIPFTFKRGEEEDVI